MTRGPGSRVTTRSPSLSCRSTNLFKIVTCFFHCLLATTILLVSSRPSNAPTPCAIRCPHGGSASMVMTVHCRTHDQLQHCWEDSSQALAASRVRCSVRNSFQLFSPAVLHTHGYLPCRKLVLECLCTSCHCQDSLCRDKPFASGFGFIDLLV